MPSTGSDSNETIEVKRRRQGASEGPQGQERAEAPVRRRQGDSGGSSSGGGGGGGQGLPPIGLPGGGGSALGCTKLPVWLIVLLIAAFVIYSLMSGGQQQDTGSSNLPTSSSDNQGQVFSQPPTEAPFPTDTFIPTVAVSGVSTIASPASTAVPANGAASGSTTGQKWTVMLYEDSDDQILEEDMYMDLNEVEKVGSTDRVNIVAQMDRFKGAFHGDGDWTSARRYYIKKDNDLQKIHSDMLQDLGEVDMADGNTLADFVSWAAKNYPADKYVLILSDHGMGWPGGWSDPDPAVQDRSKLPIASALDTDSLFLMELDKALSTIKARSGIQQFELIGMDACLMSQLEVYTMLQPYARYAVASEETEPALGWAYTGFLKALVANPDIDGSQLGRQIVSSYIVDDQRIVDDQARSDFLRQGSPMGGLFGSASVPSAASVAQQLGRDVTLTAVDLQALPGLVKSVNDLAYGLQSADQSAVADARAYAQSYTNVFGKGESPYIDLGSFVQFVKRQVGGQQINQAADQVLASIQKAVIAEKHGKGKPGATGIAIYFPNSTLYRSPVAGPQSYTGTASRFAQVTLWDDFLAFHYNDISFKSGATAPVVPPSSAPSRAPGLGQIQLSAVRATGATAAPGKPVTLNVDVSGKNIGYIYLLVGYYDTQSNSIFLADTDYLESPQTRELNGVYYPVWSKSGKFTMKFSWDPTVFQISDGKKSVTALLTPQRYGASSQDAVYTVDGTYTYTSGGEKRPARLYFRDGQLRQVFGFNSQDPAAAPHEIIPQAGDTFTITETWLDLDQSGRVTQTATQPGETLTFGSQMFTWKEVYAAPGSYAIGFIVQDLDGNKQEVYTQVEVK